MPLRTPKTECMLCSGRADVRANRGSVGHGALVPCRDGRREAGCSGQGRDTYLMRRDIPAALRRHALQQSAAACSRAIWKGEFDDGSCCGEGADSPPPGRRDSRSRAERRGVRPIRLALARAQGHARVPLPELPAAAVAADRFGYVRPAAFRRQVARGQRASCNRQTRPPAAQCRRRA
jgi:hypothetical protein